MCGPSSQMETLAGKSASFADQLHADFSQRFAQQDAALAQLKSTILGPSGRGFSPEEKAAYESTALTGSAAANINAQRAAGAYGAGQGGGGTSGLTSGIAKQIHGEIASQQAGALAGEQLGIEKADWATGREQKWKTAAGLSALAGQYDPSIYGQMSMKEGETAFGEADKIQQMKNAKQKAIAGMITSAAMGAATFGIGAAGAGGGFMDTLKGGFGALTGQDLLSNPVPGVSDPGFGIDIPKIG